MSAAHRWWIYQRERFPLLAHGPLIAAFSFSAVSFSALLRGATPAPMAVVSAFVSALLFFLQLRIADEFKDFDEDRRFRPYRPVPRGLVTLRELGILGAASAVVQLGVALIYHPPLIGLLFATWTYLALMSREFFVRDWLKARPLTYLWSHMLIMPLVDLYATASDWLPTVGAAPHGLFWFLVASFFNGVVIELGRKIRAPKDEETGVETYSVLWGRRRAVGAWLLALALSMGSACLAAVEVHFVAPMVIVAVVFWSLSAVIGAHFLRRLVPGLGKRFELASAAWTLALYGSLGVAPWL